MVDCVERCRQVETDQDGEPCQFASLVDADLPVCIDRFASLAMAGAKTSAHDLSSEHGSVSSGDDLFGIYDSSLCTSPIVTG